MHSSFDHQLISDWLRVAEVTSIHMHQCGEEGTMPQWEPGDWIPVLAMTRTSVRTVDKSFHLSGRFPSCVKEIISFDAFRNSVQLQYLEIH